MNSLSKAVVVATFAYLMSTVVSTPWLGSFPMVIFIPVIVVLGTVGLSGALLGKVNLAVIPTLLALFLAIPIRVGPHWSYAVVGVVQLYITLNTQRPVTHIGVNLIPVVLLLVFLYCLFRMDDSPPQLVCNNAAANQEPIDCMNCGRTIPGTMGICTHCGWSYGTEAESLQEHSTDEESR
jgi:hypothetical protein